jgi:hypothetical protein
MALNLGLDLSFDNMQEWKGIQQNAGDVNTTKFCIECPQKCMYIQMLITQNNGDSVMVF